MVRTAGRVQFWYHGWNIVAIAVLGQVAALGLTLNCFSLFLHSWTEAFHVPVSAIALAVTGFGIACAVLAPMVGLLADRAPARWVYGVGLCLLAACHFAIGFMAGRWQLILVYALPLPIAITFCSAILGQALVSRWFVHRRGLAMGLTAFGAALGGVIFPPLVVILIPTIGWRATWWLFGGLILLVVMPLILIAARDRPEEEEGRAYVTTASATVRRPAVGWGDILSRRNFWVAAVVFATAQSCFMSMTVNLAPLANARGLGATYAGGLLSLLGIAALSGKLIAGLLIDRFGNRFPLVLTPLFCTVGAVVIALAPRGGLPLIVGVAMIGVGGASWTLLASITATEFGAHGFGRAYGLISATTPFATLVAPILARSEESLGSYTPGLLGLGAFALSGTLVAAFLRQPHATAARKVDPLDETEALRRASG